MNMRFPFAELDVSKLLANFNVPSFEIDTLAEAQRRNLACFQEVGLLTTKCMQAMAQRQVEMAQKSVEGVVAGASDFSRAATPEDGAKCQAKYLQGVFERQLANLSELGEMAQKAQSEMFGVVNKRFIEGIDELMAVATPETPVAGEPARTAASAAKPKASK